MQMLTKDNIKDLCECSPLQKGILFHALDQPKNPAYFQQISFSIRGSLSLPSVKTALKKLIQKYESLRTVFSYQDFKEPIQIILKETELSFRSIDCSHLTESESSQQLQTVLKDDREQGFDLTRGPLIRFFLFRLKAEHYVMVWSFHHILMDGWCLGILLNDWLDFYQQSLDQQLEPVRPAPSYRRYIEWMKKQDQKKALNYWRQYLDGLEDHASLGRTSWKESYEEHHTLSFSFSSMETEQIVKWTHHHQITLSNFVSDGLGHLITKDECDSRCGFWNSCLWSTFRSARHRKNGWIVY